MGGAPGSRPRLLVLLGRPVAHSRSPAMHNAAMAAAGLAGRYVAVDCGADDLPALVRGVGEGGGGGNVTVPHKAAVAALLDEPSPRVRATGACNTFWGEDGRIHGDNTDVPGVAEALAALGWPVDEGGGGVLLLGAGGAARGVLRALEEGGHGGPVRIRNRTRQRAEVLARESGAEVDDGAMGAEVPEGTRLVVNATSLGLDEGDPFPLEPHRVPEGVRVLDLVYRPGRTRWVRALRALGIPALDGREMLLAQGAHAFRRWWGVDPDRQAMERAFGGGGDGNGSRDP